MYDVNLRPYGEYFAQAQAITTSLVEGNQAANNPMRMDASQSGAAIRMATPRAIGSLAVASNASVTLTVLGAKTEGGTYVTLGTAVYTNEGESTKTFGPDAAICDFVMPDMALLAHPYIKVQVSGSAAPTGSVDVFPHYISRPGR